MLHAQQLSNHGISGEVVYYRTEELTLPHSWEHAIDAGAPDTKSDHVIRLAGRCFERPLQRTQPARFAFMWAGADSKTATRCAQIWAQSAGLRLSSPYEVLALSKQYPKLFLDFSETGCGFVATEHCVTPEPHVCGIWQSSKGFRNAGLIRTDLKFYDRTIFVFGTD